VLVFKSRSARLLNTSIYGYPKQPRTKAGPFVEPHQIAQHQREDLLDCICRLFLVQQHAPGNRKDLVVVPGIELLERTLITRQKPVDEENVLVE
jgi:hypothetical protein